HHPATVQQRRAAEQRRIVAVQPVTAQLGPVVEEVLDDVEGARTLWMASQLDRGEGGVLGLGEVAARHGGHARTRAQRPPYARSRVVRIGRSSVRDTTASIMPWESRNSAFWNPSGSWSRAACSITRPPANPMRAPGS